MTPSRAARAALVPLGLTLALALAGCGGETEPGAAPDPTVEAPPTSEAEEPTDAPATGEPEPGVPFGEGCAGLPTGGPDSLSSLVEQPVSGALADYPELTALHQALQATGLGDTLDAQQAVTVLAPSDGAFAGIPPEQLQTLLADPAGLGAVLGFHVLQGRLGPDELAGEQPTLGGATLVVEGSGEEFSIPAEYTLGGRAPATVVCGGIQAANATIHVIDQVLQPPAG
ncbi:fasciclin domain-containing protein [Geodermatophilus sp. YIM 151500]|uniref:fasciclin domain-containing protein n=1 Tax=Geodermatophilus sp. YIM 151500 TaxID=2984531 RepID=UPI0021E3A3E2|nr:fasciclin domain-containing protein [Geodermatophilus sp. YIM 151500]MCV2490240.1 fasciclin domain-containing protein [Geodermatophilus sp. YIM 151500]